MHLAVNIPILLVEVAVILVLSRVMGMLFARMRQPQVMGEMIAGIMLGPSLLGILFPAVSQSLFPASNVQVLNALSQVGVIFFLFLIGLELDPKLIRNRGHAAVVISHASIIAPFLLGAALAMFLFPRLFNAVPTMRFVSVALFMGASMSITAFPVLARILTERNLHKTKVGAVAITCAAVDDVTAWCMLAFVVAVARAAGLRPALLTALFSLIYVAAMFFVVRPFLRRLEQIYEQTGRLGQNIVALIFLLILASAYTTEKIGIHALFGAFLMGAIMPKGTKFVRNLSEKLEDFTVVFLLPIFFAFTGLRTQIGVLNSPGLWVFTFLIILVACMGKFGGSTIAARACGLGWRESSAIGILMNTRGLMELVILNLGKDLGVITDAVFAMMVIMAIVTTFLTTPVLHWVYPAAMAEAAEESADEKTRKAGKRFSVLIPISLPTSGGPLVAMADLLVDRRDTPRQIIALNLRRPVDREAYRSGLDEATAARPETLEPLMLAATERNIPVEPISFISRDVPSDIARVARSRHVDMILMGFHKPVFGQTILGGTVHRVMTASDCDIVVFVDRGFEGGDRLMVPYLGGNHDRLALHLAGRIARNSGASLTILHIVPPRRSNDEETMHAKTTVERMFADPTQPTQITFKVIEDPSPVDAVVQQAKQFDLIIVGVEEEWGLESHLFGFRPERIARECPGSLLVVRRHSKNPVPKAIEEMPVKPAADEPPAIASPAAAEPAPVSTGK